MRPFVVLAINMTPTIGWILVGICIFQQLLLAFAVALIRSAFGSRRR